MPHVARAYPNLILAKLAVLSKRVFISGNYYCYSSFGPATDVITDVVAINP